MKTKWVQNLLIIFVIFVFGYLIIGELLLPKDNLGADDKDLSEFNSNWFRVLEDGTKVSQKVPGSCDAKRNELITLETTLPAHIPHTTYLCFRSGKQDMNFYVDGELRQRYETNTTRKIGQFSAVAYIFVRLSPDDAGKTLTFTSQTGSSYTGIFYTVYQGSQFAMWKYYFKFYGGELIVALLIIALGAIAITTSIAFRHYYHRRIDLEFLAWGGLFAGVWEITNSVFRQLIFPNMSVINDLAFYMIMLLPLPYLLYVDGIQKSRYSLAFRVIETIVVINFTVCSALHITDIADFADTIIIMAVICIATILFIFTTIIRDYFKGYLMQYRYVAIGMFCAFLCAIIQIITYFQKTKLFSGIVLAIGLIILMIFAIFNAIIDFINIESEKNQALLASKSKGEFLANMSHEIRTPINAILGLDTMILRESGEPKIREYALDIEYAGQTLLSLINDILDLSKIEQGKMEIVPVEYELSSLIHDVVNMISVKAQAKNLKLQINIEQSLPSRLYGDDVRLRQILLNLLNNAVKYTEKGEITLEISGHPDDSGQGLPPTATTSDKYELLHFSVKDTGIGIKESDMDKLFSAFERIEEERNRNIEGTGLGMSITVKLLDLMGSKLFVESVYGSGSEFHFELLQKVTDVEPIGDLQQRIANREPHYATDTKLVAPNAHVLVVDDNAMNIKVFMHLLKNTMINIDEADGGIRALELIFNTPYDIIFLDHMMPDMNGIEVLKQMKEAKEHPNSHTPVIALTANAITGSREMYLEAGFDDYLCKPVNPEKLEKMIMHYLPETSYSVTNHDTEAEKELPYVEGIDWEYALMKLADKELALSMAENFEAAAAREMKALNRMWKDISDAKNTTEKNDAFLQYRIKVHSMKSSASMIGATGVAALARILEYAARDFLQERIDGLMPVFEQEWNTLTDSLAEALTKDSSSGDDNRKTGNDNRESLDNTMFLQYLDMLNNAMSTLDVDTADAIIEELNKYRYENTVAEMLDKLSGYVNDLDIERVAGVIQKLHDIIDK